MALWNRIRRSDFFIRLLHWEYWPFGIVQFPIFFYYPWLSLRAGSFTFFSGSNPGILMGGMFGESKYEVLRKIPSSRVPKTLLIRQPVSAAEILDLIEKEKLCFPLIFKPDIGERGYMVKRILSTEDASRYLDRMKFDFLVQELVDLPVEAGIFYQRYPDAEKGRVTSIVLKEMLSVTGDGKSTLKDLILNNDRAKLQWKVLSQTYSGNLGEVLADGERFELVSIGNHCLGTRFINGNHLITPELTDAFDSLSKGIEGFFFGRFDLRCSSVEDLQTANVIILELNGCGAEPAHIYDSAFPLGEAVRTLIVHWRTIFEIARENKKLGHRFLPLKEALSHYKAFKSKIR